jgi:hypothetical protein
VSCKPSIAVAQLHLLNYIRRPNYAAKGLCISWDVMVFVSLADLAFHLFFNVE